MTLPHRVAATALARWCSAIATAPDAELAATISSAVAELVGTETIGSLPQALEVLSAFGSDAGRSQVEQATATVLTDVIALRLEVASRQERSDETVAARAYASGSDPSTDTFTGLAWWEYDPISDTHNWSPEMWAISGLDPADGSPCLGDWLALIHPDDRPEAEATSSRSLADQVTHLAVFRIVRPDGEVRLLQSWHSNRLGPDGSVVSMFGTTLDITERRAANRVLHETERRMLAARRLTGIASWSVDLPTGRLTWSDEMFALVGREPGSVEPTLDMWLEHLHPDDRDRCSALRLEAQATGRGYENVLRIRRLDGELRWLQTWSSVETDADRVVRHEWGLSIDVTERERAAALRADSEHRLEAAYALTGLAWWEWHFEPPRLSWSDGMYALVGLAPENGEATLADWLALVDPADRAAAAELELVAVEEGLPYRHVFRVHLADGRTKYLQSWTEPLRAADGAIAGLRGATLDVTERTLTEQAVAESEEHFRVAFADAPNGMAMVGLTGDSAGQVVRTNAALADLLGFELDEFMGLPWREWSMPDEFADHQARFAAVVEAKAPESFEARLRRKDGTPVHAWVTMSVVLGPDQQPLFVVAHFIDDTNRRLQQQTLQRLALTDELTELANRSVVNQQLSEALAALDARHEAVGAGVGLLLLDVDRFKLVNDTLGHPIGDSLLVEIATRLRAVTRGGTTVGRLGGDEFILLVADTFRPAELELMAERILAALRLPFELPSGDTVNVTTSLGIAFTTDADTVPEELLRQADLALYHAKDNGRDRSSLYDDALHAQTLDRVRTETMVRAALRDGGLRVVFQPVVSLATRQIVGAEALVRLMHPERGEIAPGEFIEVAEDSGMIAEIDSWVVEEVIRMLALDEPGALGHGAGRLPARVAVNVSGRTIQHPAFVAQVAAALDFYGVPGERLLVELTESSLLDDNPTILDALMTLDDLGVDTGIDDFGTGYSALAYLRRFRFSFLKIDRSFVAQLGTDNRANAVVAAVISLAHAHDLLVTAEGIETQEQADMLLAMGCDHGQGWLFGRPVSVDRLPESLVSDWRP